MTPILLSVALKGLVVLAAAFGLLAGLRGAPPALRHGVWTAAFAALLVLPALDAFGPTWSVPMLPSIADGAMTGFGGAVSGFDDEVIVCDDAFECGPVSAIDPLVWSGAEAESHLGEGVALWDHLDHAHVVSGEHEVTTFVDGSHVQTKQTLGGDGVWLLGLWAFGALGVLLRWAAAYASAAFIVRAAAPVTDDGWLDAAERARRLLGLDRDVRLLVSDRLTVPVAWGWGAPAVVLPPDADGWDEDRRDAVLLHEMAHVKRGDARTQLVAQLALALHWPNPLAWLGYRRFLTEREHACDDAVLSGGATPSAYAGHLVDIARNVGREPHALAALAPMARRSDLERRVVSVLDAGRRRVAAGRSGLARAVVLGLCVAAPLGVLRPVAAADGAPDLAWSEIDTVDAPVLDDADSTAWDDLDNVLNDELGDIEDLPDDLADAAGLPDALAQAALVTALRDTIPRADDVLGPARATALERVRTLRAEGRGLSSDAWDEIEREVEAAFDDARIDYESIVRQALAEARTDRAESLADAEADRREAMAEMAEAVAARNAAQSQGANARRAADRNARARQQDYAEAEARAQALREADRERQRNLREAQRDREEAQRDREEALREARQERAEAQREREEDRREAQREREEDQRDARREREEDQRDARRERTSNRQTNRRDDRQSQTRSQSSSYTSVTRSDGTTIGTRTDASVGPWMAEMDQYDQAVSALDQAVTEVRRRGAQPGELSGLRGGFSGLRGAIESMPHRPGWPRSDTEKRIARSRVAATRARIDVAEARLSAR